MKRIVIGIMPPDKIRARVIAIARGQYKPKPGDPKIWFPSMKSVAETLSDKNMALIRIIATCSSRRACSISRMAIYGTTPTTARGRRPFFCR